VNSKNEYAHVAAIFRIDPEFWRSQDWGEFGDPSRVEEFVTAYERCEHVSVWTDQGLATLIWDSFAKQWYQYDAVDPTAIGAIERFIARWHRRLGVRSYLSMMAGLEDRPGDEYPECSWLRERWEALTGVPLDELLGFELLKEIDDPANEVSGKPPALPMRESAR
jgi:hypothetical protein